MKSLELINEAVSDCVQDLLYHNRTNDEDLREGDIEEAVHDRQITLDDIVQIFRLHLEKEFAIHSDVHGEELLSIKSNSGND